MVTSTALRDRLLDEIMDISAIDVHSHVPAEEPCASRLRDILGYHYFTELAHSAGLDKSVLDDSVPDEEMIPQLLDGMKAIRNTVQHSWLTELARDLFDFNKGIVTSENWQELDEAIQSCYGREGRAREVLNASSIERVFLTNSFDEDLSRVDTDMFVPSLRADNLVFEMEDPAVRRKLEEVADTEIKDVKSLRSALRTVFSDFISHGAKSAAISLPPHCETVAADDSEVQSALDKALRAQDLDAEESRTLQSGVFFALAELCGEFDVPMQVMYGARRGAYDHGVPKGMDICQAGDSLAGILPLLNSFPDVTFCLSVLNEGLNQELVNYGWIFHNVVLSGHWWYLNVPTYIERDLAARLQAVPGTKLIGYYSDMYKLEFGLPKFNMYRRSLANVLAEEYIVRGLGDEGQAIELARSLLRHNAQRIFGV